MYYDQKPVNGEQKGGGGMDNLERECANDGIVTGPKPLLVCPVCGPKTMMYAGNILVKTCKRCEELLNR